MSFPIWNFTLNSSLFAIFVPLILHIHSSQGKTIKEKIFKRWQTKSKEENEKKIRFYQ
jgi:hypothetical protein